MKTLKFLILFFLILSSEALAEEPAWELVSMNPPRGTVSNLFKSDNNDLYSFSINNDYLIYYSSNSGDNWNWFGDINLCGLLVYNNILYTEKVVPDIDGSNYCLFKSYDNGKNWIEIAGIWNKKNPVSRLVRDSNKIYVGIYVSKDIDIYLTTDEGTSWEYRGRMVGGGLQTGFSNLYMHKNVLISFGKSKFNGSYIFISKDAGKTWEIHLFEFADIYMIILKSVNEIYLTSDNGIWLSTDTCKTWVQKYFDKENIYGYGISDDNKYQIVSSNSRGILYSTDYGKTWDISEDFKRLQLFQQYLAIYFLDKEHIYVSPGFMGLYQTLDYGKTWVEKNNGYSSDPPRDFNIVSNNDMYISHFGIFKTENSGKNFSLKGNNNTFFTCIAVNKKGYIFVGQGEQTLNDQSIFRSTDNGETWESCYNRGSMINCIVIDSKDNIYAVVSTANVIRSTDDGKTWTNLTAEGDQLAVNNEDDVFSFEWSKIRRSTDKGLTWDSHPALKEPDPTLSYGSRKIVFNNKTKTTWFGPLPNADHSFWGIFKTTDNGRTWNTINLDQQGLEWYPSASRVAVDSLGCWVGTKNGDKFGIYRS